jgi:pimeloyl-ACP methyl ester carboxylesterase
VPHMIADEVEGRLDRIRTPALVVNGERDPIVPRDWAQQVATLLENGRLEIVPGAHVIMYTAAEQIGRLIEDFAGD